MELREPACPASSIGTLPGLREAIKSGASNLKERLFIQLEPDKSSNTQFLNRRHVQFNGWNFTCGLVDLLAIIGSHKTIDNKMFYKMADICQLIIYNEELDFDVNEDTKSPDKKNKDPNKVDKKHSYPYGFGPPLKITEREDSGRIEEEVCIGS